MIYAGFMLIGIGAGIILSFILWPRKAADPPAADLVFDHEVSEELPYLAVRSRHELEGIRAKKYVTLKVVVVKAKSHK